MEHPTVASVLEIAQDILNQNKCLDVETLYNTAKRILKIPRKGLMRIVNFLFSNKYLLKGTKFTKQSVLFNPNRKLIYDFIKENLGAHYSFIRRSAPFVSTSPDIGGGQLAWHLEMLLKFDYVKKIRIKNKSIFIPSELPEEVAIVHYFLRDNLIRTIIEYINQKTKAEIVEIYKNLEISRHKVYYKVNLLVENEIVVYNGGDGKFLYLNPDKKMLISNILKKIECKEVLLQ
ncbi:MAG: hypothetical protein JW891_15965 [Candidatus Lokiarchaeota archaeon]|nr:hypothetical protein [Candidatus Lokiarchaeota archaeon]